MHLFLSLPTFSFVARKRRCMHAREIDHYITTNYSKLCLTMKPRQIQNIYILFSPVVYLTERRGTSVYFSHSPVLYKHNTRVWRIFLHVKSCDLHGPLSNPTTSQISALNLNLYNLVFRFHHTRCFYRSIHVIVA